MTQEQMWVVYDHEVSMLKELTNIMKSEDWRTDYSKTVSDAIVESTCLHTRILVDILISKSNRDDDIAIAKLLPDDSFQSVDDLSKYYGKSDEPNTPCWLINKKIFHPTTKRSSEGDYTKQLNELLPKIFSIHDEIQRARNNHAPLTNDCRAVALANVNNIKKDQQEPTLTSSQNTTFGVVHQAKTGN
jgi:hypothetical protein